MDARVAESAVTSNRLSWLERERASGRFYQRAMHNRLAAGVCHNFFLWLTNVGHFGLQSQ